MKNLFCCAALLALPLLAAAQTTTPKPATKQVTEVTEDLDPKTGKVVRRTTRTTTLPVDAPTSATTPAGTTDTTLSPTIAEAPASDAVVSDFFREKTTVSTLSTTDLLDAYARFEDKVRTERRGWTTADWANAASVMRSLNGRYDQLRSSFSLNDKVTVRSQQVEFQTLRTARQISKDVSDKL